MSHPQMITDSIRETVRETTVPSDVLGGLADTLQEIQFVGLCSQVGLTKIGQWLLMSKSQDYFFSFITELKVHLHLNGIPNELLVDLVDTMDNTITGMVNSKDVYEIYKWDNTVYSKEVLGCLALLSLYFQTFVGAILTKEKPLTGVEIN